VDGEFEVRVSRFGEFLPFGLLFLHFLKLCTEVAQIFGLILNGKSYALILTKKGIGQHFWPIFEIKHLVTMLHCFA
jgi:hypothetical protein